MRNKRWHWLTRNGKEEGVVHYSCMTLFISLPISRLNETNTSENQKIDSNLTSRWLELILLKVLERSEPRWAIEGSMWGSSQMGSRDVWKSNRNHIKRPNRDEGDGCPRWRVNPNCVSGRVGWRWVDKTWVSVKNMITYLNKFWF